MRKDNQELLEKIQKGFNEVHRSEIDYCRKEWTQVFLKKLKEIGQDDYKVYPSSNSDLIPKKNGEWLFDLIWSCEGPGENDWKQKYTGLKLICESEWDTNIDAILYDFQKLAVGKADIKIMLVQFNNSQNFEAIINACEESIDASLYNDGSTYILVGSGNNENEIKWVELWKNKI